MKLVAWMAGVLLAATSAGAADKDLYKDLVAPLMESKCTGCHGDKKAKGKLKLNSHAAILKGGEDGKVVTPGQPDKSSLYKNLTLPLSDEDHMPPEDKPQPSKAEVALIRWWIEKGAPESLALSAAGAIPDDVKPAVEAAK